MGRRSNLVAWWLPWTRKLYDFYSAPVVKFWFHTVGPVSPCYVIIHYRVKSM